MPVLLDACTPADAAREDLIRDVLSRFSGRWPLLVSSVLAGSDGPLRFTRVLEQVHGITQKVLTQTLRQLERDGLVTRTIHPQVPPRVDYELTALGRELLVLLDPIILWARDNAEQFRRAQARFDGSKAT